MRGRYVRGEPFQQEHWAALFRKLSIEKVDLAKLTLGHFLAAGQALIDGAEEVKTLSARATGEIAIREAIGEVSSWAAETSFSLTKHADASGREVALIKDWKDLTTQVSDLQALLALLKESPFFGGFADRVADFEKKLATLDQLLAVLNPIQRKWVHLARLRARRDSHPSTRFSPSSTPSSATHRVRSSARRDLHEQASFRRVDDEFRALMSSIVDAHPHIPLKVPQLVETLTSLLDQLERCQKALSDFLEQKRKAFPRFYFIGDDDLLEILGQAKNPAVIQSHLKKLFAGIFFS